MANAEFTPKGEEDVRAEVIEDLGLDVEEHSELIDKITAERLEHQKSLSTAIRQKRDKAKALEDMKKGKDFYKKKAGFKEPKGSNSSNEQIGLSREEAILYSQGFADEDVKLASKLSKLNGISLIEATKDDYFLAKVQERKDKAKAEKAGLPPAQGGGHSTEKNAGDMTREEHQAYVAEELRKAGLS